MSLLFLRGAWHSFERNAAPKPARGDGFRSRPEKETDALFFTLKKKSPAGARQVTGVWKV
ncbi:MAG: hypothetical protein D6714_20045 [Bacteroidetes bacterium]|nr:MAG: hypothetical protein D6714_20045 [Bacteroidota bacterium]